MPTDPGDVLTRVRETPPPPSPAAEPAPEPGALSPLAALSWLGLALAFATLAYALALQLEPGVVQRVPNGRSPDELERRARDGLRRLGIAASAHQARGFAYDDVILDHVVQREHGAGRFENLRTGQPAAVYFWYVESHEPLLAAPGSPERAVVEVRLDTTGRLVFLRREAQRDVVPLLARREPDWARLFVEAGLDPKRFRRIEPLFVPPVFADSRGSWIGAYASRPEIRVRVDAAALHGRPVYFDIVGPWSLQPARRLAVAGWPLAGALLVAPALLLARRRLRLPAGDGGGALKLGAAGFALALLQWALQAPHAAEPLLEWSSFQEGAARALAWSGSLWLCFVAAEPCARALRPEALASWDRLLAGRLRDALVGRDVLIGLAAGYAILVLGGLVLASPATFDSERVRLAAFGDLRALVGTWPLLGALCEAARFALQAGLLAFALLLLMQLLLRRAAPAALGYVLVAALVTEAAILTELRDVYALDLLLLGALQALTFALATRVGLVGLLASLVPAGIALALPLIGGNWNAWYAPSLLVPLAAQAGLLWYAFSTALGGRAVLSDEALR